MSKRDRLRRQARRTPFIDPRPVILILTEGAVTEKQYLDGFAASLHNVRVKVEVVGGVGVPKTIVQTAKERKRAAQKRARREQDENLAYDQVWCVSMSTLILISRTLNRWLAITELTWQFRIPASNFGSGSTLQNSPASRTDTHFRLE